MAQACPIFAGDKVKHHAEGIQIQARSDSGTVPLSEPDLRELPFRVQLPSRQTEGGVREDREVHPFQRHVQDVDGAPKW